MVKTEYAGFPDVDVGFDAAGNITSHNDGSGLEDFTYDVNFGSANRDDSTVNGVFSFTKGGVRDTRFYNVQGQQVSALANGVTQLFSWNADDRLTHFDSGNGLTADYQYDDGGQRVRKTVFGGGSILEDRLFVTPTYWVDLAGPGTGTHSKMFNVGAANAFQTKHPGHGDTAVQDLQPLYITGTITSGGNWPTPPVARAGGAF